MAYFDDTYWKSSSSEFSADTKLLSYLATFFNLYELLSADDMLVFGLL